MSMWLRMSSPKSNPRRRVDGAARHRCLAPAGQALALVLLLWLLIAPVVPSAAQQAALTTKISHVFGESLTFELRGTAAGSVTKAVLFYGQQGEGLVRRIYPPFTPAQQLDIVFVEELESGQYAPGAEMVAWWELYLANGETQATERLTHIYSDDYHDWALLQGEHVDYYWYGSDAARAQELLQTAESVIARLSDEVGVAVDRRVKVYAYNSDRDMARALSSRSESFDDRVLTLGVAVGNETLLLLASHADVKMTTAHELSHVVVGMATDNPYSDLPRWLDEGLAMYAEGELPAGNREALDHAVAADALLSVRSLSSYSGQANEVDLFYGEAYSIVSFMLDTYGRDKMQAFLAVFGKGARQEDALQQVYGLTLAGLDDAWRASLGLAPRPKPQATTAPGSSATQERALPTATPEPSLAQAQAAATLVPLQAAPTAPPAQAQRAEEQAPPATASVGVGSREQAKRGVCPAGALALLPLLGAALVRLRVPARVDG